MQFFVLSVKNTVLLVVNMVLVLLEMDPPSLSATPTLLAIPILVKNGKPVVLPFSSTDISIRKTTEEITKAFLLYYLNDMSDKLN